MATSTAYSTVMRSELSRVPSDASSVKLSKPTGLMALLNPDQSVKA